MSDASSERPRFRPARGIIVALSIFVAVAVLLVAIWYLAPRLLGSKTQHITIKDDRLAVSITVPRDISMTGAYTRPEAPCDPVAWDFGRDLTIQMFSASCEIPDDPSAPLNGRHGVYRSIDDVADPIDATTVDTPLGTAQVFTQKYTECTNFCTDYDEHIAIIALESPADAAFDSVVVRADYGNQSRDDLTEILRSMRPLSPNE